ncbi:MAG: pyrroline-5-carboxylate reductase [Deltaproteobacteria bacterium]|nr:pyrroline-5-carboxylate reductase [Deltaproteobacteria bacterium]MBW2047509.1 pyrroline-5-carboxylate reductase [Deltaproteobacteria bacterium]MBW2111735.1 pyrroline-5-carboxylate reductase [Deltaproteobacteria bacterium]MBW2352100.1 pyrroline-5-carboxylate reductase [Deltaproteobacteria bacterium]HDZ91705.1 pyrroline-5-carboxylate reductase [Deltaproteobacteria bacterium]
MSGNHHLGFIGAGNMATALIRGLVESGLYQREHLWAADKDKEALEKVRESFGIRCEPSNLKVTREASTLILAVKPQNMREALEEIRGGINYNHLLISIAAGIPLRMIRQVIGREIPLIRVMPNTPALVQKGISALAAGDLATASHMAEAREIFGAVGHTVVVEEVMMDAVTALSGSGPGYVFRMMECMVEAGAGVGLEKETCLSLVVQTFLGAAHLARESDEPLSRLREKVTSPGGTTAAGLAVFDNMGLKEMTMKAVDAACRRSVELGRDY